jgi:hypothetical protein
MLTASVSSGAGHVVGAGSVMALRVRDWAGAISQFTISVALSIAIIFSVVSGIQRVVTREQHGNQAAAYVTGRPTTWDTKNCRDPKTLVTNEEVESANKSAVLCFRNALNVAVPALTEGKVLEIEAVLELAGYYRWLERRYHRLTPTPMPGVGSSDVRVDEALLDYKEVVEQYIPFAYLGGSTVILQTCALSSTGFLFNDTCNTSVQRTIAMLNAPQLELVSNQEAVKLARENMLAIAACQERRSDLQTETIPNPASIQMVVQGVVTPVRQGAWYRVTCGDPGKGAANDGFRLLGVFPTHMSGRQFIWEVIVNIVYVAALGGIAAGFIALAGHWFKATAAQTRPWMRRGAYFAAMLSITWISIGYLF